MLGKSEKTQQLIRANNSFTRESTKIAKGFAIVLMLCHHLFAFPDRIGANASYIPMFTVGGVSIEQWFGIYGGLCVYVFVCLGGYGTYISLKKSENMFSSLKTKIKQLYFSYWKVFAVFIPICMLLSAPRVEKNLYPFIMNFLGLSSSYNGEWWFFLPYVIVIMLFPVIFRFIERKHGYFFGDLLLIAVVQYTNAYILPVVLKYSIFQNVQGTLFLDCINKVTLILPSFLFGCVCAKYNLFEGFLKLFKNRFVMILSSLGILLLSFYFRKKTQMNFDFLIAPLVSVASVGFIQNIKPLRILFSKIGNQSTNIWLIHSFYCYALCQEFIYAPKYSILILILLIIVSYISGILLDSIWDPKNTLKKIKEYAKIKI